MAFFPSRKTFSIWAIVLLGFGLAAPQAFAEAQPGTQLLLQLDRQDVISRRLADLRDEIEARLLEMGIDHTGLSASSEAIWLHVPASEAEAARAVLLPLLDETPGSLALDEPEPGRFGLTLTTEGVDGGVERAAVRSVEVIGRRIKELNVQPPTVERQGADRILVKVPGLKDSGRLKEILARAGRLTLQFVDESMTVDEALGGTPPVGSVVLYSADRLPLLVERRAALSGENIVDAQAGIDKYVQVPVVTFVFDEEGKAKFGKVTAENVGRQLAIVLDEIVMSAPVIREPILGGTGQISGNFTLESAEDLALLLRAGSLPAALTIIEERVNEPLQGQDAKN
jgi:SecD/SecF fusion protein